MRRSTRCNVEIRFTHAWGRFEHAAMVHKIMIAQGQQSGATALSFYCEKALCHGAGEMRIDEALKRWGGDRHIDTLPVYCARCGSREVDVRPHFPRY
jgi:hypothetical protein